MNKKTLSHATQPPDSGAMSPMADQTELLPFRILNLHRRRFWLGLALRFGAVVFLYVGGSGIGAVYLFSMQYFGLLPMSPDVSPTLILFLLGLYGIFPIVVYIWRYATVLYHRGRRISIPDPEVWLRNRTRRTVLLLRSFTDDALVSSARSRLMLSSNRYEDQVVAAVRKLGLVISLGRPGEPYPETGARRLYVPDTDWQAAIQYFLREAMVVIIIVGPGTNLWWEIEQALARVPLHHLLFLFPDAYAESRGILKRISKIAQMTADKENRYSLFRQRVGASVARSLPERIGRHQAVAFDRDGTAFMLRTRLRLSGYIYVNLWMLPCSVFPKWRDFVLHKSRISIRRTLRPWARTVLRQEGAFRAETDPWPAVLGLAHAVVVVLSWMLPIWLAPRLEGMRSQEIRSYAEASAMDVSYNCWGAAGRIPVAILLPLVGSASDLGKNMLDGASMALSDVGPNDICLLPIDTKGDAAGARVAAEHAVELDVRLILGPFFSPSVYEVSRVARQHGIKVLAFSSEAAAASEGTIIFRIRPEQQVSRVVNFALASGLQKIAGLAPAGPYGEVAMEALRSAVTQSGGDLGPTLLYDPAGDVAATVRELANQGGPPLDAVLIADGGERLHLVADSLRRSGLDPPQIRFLGTMRWQNDPKTLRESALQGGWFATLDPDSLGAFRSRFERVFDKSPDPLAALAYDATALAAVIPRDLGDESFASESLLDPQGFVGATGLFRFLPNGLAEHQLAVLEIRDGITYAVDPAATHFVGPSASVASATYRTVYIIDEVNNPGVYKYVRGMTVIDVINLAGGFTDWADPNDIIISRDSSSGPRIKAQFDTEVLPGDIVEVAERPSQ